MSASIFSLGFSRSRRASPPVAMRQDWSQQELAELYRVRDRLTQSGVPLSVETGLTDEGDPWAVFVHGDTGDSVVHIARLDGEIVVANLLADVVFRGPDFRAITDRMLEAAPLVMPRPAQGGGKVVLHPRSVFTAFVAAAVVLSEFVRSLEPAKAATQDDKAVSDKALAEAKGVFPHIFDRLLSRDPHWAPSGMAAAGSLMAAAVGAVLMSDREGKAEEPSFHLIEQATVPTVNLATAATAVQTSDDRAPLSGEGVVTESAEPATAPPLTKLSELRQEDVEPQPSLSGQERVASHDERSVEAAHAGLAISHEYVLPLESVSQGRIIRASAPGNAAPPATPETSSEEAKAQHQQASVEKEVVVSGAALVIARLSSDVDERDFVMSAITRALKVDESPVDESLVSVDVADEKSADRPPEAPAKKIQLDVDSDWVLHLNPAGAGPVGLASGVHDIVLISEESTTIYGFRFNEDYLLVDGAIDKTDWIKSIDISGDDVTIVAVSGAVVSLLDTHGLIA